MQKLILFFLTLVVGCSSGPISHTDIKGSFEDNKKHLELRDSFAFYHEGNEYYFGQKKVKEGKDSCYYIIGFKNDEVRYTFPSGHFSELEQFYNKNATPEERIDFTVKNLDRFQNNQENKFCYNNRLTQDDIGYIIVFSPLLVFIAPLLYVKDISNDVDDLLVNFDDIKLGMSFKEVKNLFRKRLFVIKKDNGATVYILDKANQRLVMYFKEDKLHAWVRGYKPQGDAFPLYRRAQ